MATPFGNAGYGNPMAQLAQTMARQQQGPRGWGYPGQRMGQQSQYGMFQRPGMGGGYGMGGGGYGMGQPGGGSGMQSPFGQPAGGIGAIQNLLRSAGIGQPQAGGPGIGGQIGQAPTAGDPMAAIRNSAMQQAQGGAMAGSGASGIQQLLQGLFGGQAGPAGGGSAQQQQYDPMAARQNALSQQQQFNPGQQNNTLGQMQMAQGAQGGMSGLGMASNPNVAWGNNQDPLQAQRNAMMGQQMAGAQSQIGQQQAGLLGAAGMQNALFGRGGG